MKIKDMFGLMVGSVFAGETIKSIGSNMSGGIGKATQSLVGVGLLSKASNLFFKK